MIFEPGPSPVPRDHPLEADGSSLFPTPIDYRHLLHSILSHKILKPVTMNLLFAPQLNNNAARDPNGDCGIRAQTLNFRGTFR
ncbi:hypothetical protein F5Y19DRAFT_457744 [Xylariaceae sp. FL1651]|nr:hypothetical protein F5Y19DRAFT_457744 [Xylariaceae sp. FL1651]